MQDQDGMELKAYVITFCYFNIHNEWCEEWDSHPIIQVKSTIIEYIMVIFNTKLRVNKKTVEFLSEQENISTKGKAFKDIK